MPNFETFKKRMVPLVKSPFVTIQTRGTMSMNAAAHAALGSPEAIELLYDADEAVIGMRKVEKEVEHAYPIRGMGGKAEGTSYMVSGTAFMKYYGIDTSVSTRYPVRMVDGVLCIFLKEGGTVVTQSRRAKPWEATPAE